MIDFLRLEHFKCFESLRLPLSNLTLLTGVNAAGKSTIIQSLALLSQSDMLAGSTTLCLNGDLVQLGSFDDVVDKETGRDEFVIGLDRERTHLEWRFQSDDRASLVATCPPRSPTDILPGTDKGVTGLENDIRDLGYLCTDRIGPRETYLVDTAEPLRPTIGPKGEFTPWYIHRQGQREVTEKLRQSGATWTLQRQIEAWLGDFFPGAGMEVTPVPGVNLVVLKIRTRPDGKFHRPQNVGYGVTHILPVLTACLGARPGQVLIIENPEAHLHPAAQGKMGHFLARVAAAGVQLIVESHSDHILNGVRRAVREGEITPDQLGIHFFNRRETVSAGGSQIVSPVINSDGQIDSWPEGFFDQYEKDLAVLTGWT